MKKPANAGAHGLFGIVASQADSSGYAARTSAFQARRLSRLYGLTPAVAAVIAAHAYSVLRPGGPRHEPGAPDPRQGP